MRRLVIRDRRGHVEMDLDTEEAIAELERQMNAGMLAVATTGTDSVMATGSADPVLREAEEVRLMWPLAGGRSRFKASTAGDSNSMLRWPLSGGGATRIALI